MSVHKGYKAKLLQAMAGGQLVSVGDAAEIMGKACRKDAARFMNRGVRDGWWKVAGPRHAASGDRGSHRRFGTDEAALLAYEESTAAPGPVAVDGHRLNRRIGAVLGAIRDLHGIKARCTVDETTDCWIWGFSVAGVGKIPHANVDGRNLSIVRMAFQYATGKKVQQNRIVWRTCCTKLCLNPEHMRQGTRAQHGQWVKEQGNQRGNLKRIRSSRAAAAARTIVTPEIARQIMLSDKPPAAWAVELGVTTRTVLRALVRRRTDAAPNSSVFAWRPAA